MCGRLLIDQLLERNTPLHGELPIYHAGVFLYVRKLGIFLGEFGKMIDKYWKLRYNICIS